MSGSASVQWFLPTHGDGRYLAVGAQHAKAGQLVALAITSARTPKEIRGRVHAVVTSVLKDPAIVIRLRDLSFEPVGGNGAAFTRLFDETVKTFGDIATERQIVAGD